MVSVSECDRFTEAYSGQGKQVKWPQTDQKPLTVALENHQCFYLTRWGVGEEAGMRKHFLQLDRERSGRPGKQRDCPVTNQATPWSSAQPNTLKTTNGKISSCLSFLGKN